MVVRSTTIGWLVIGYLDNQLVILPDCPLIGCCFLTQAETFSPEHLDDYRFV